MQFEAHPESGALLAAEAYETTSPFGEVYTAAEADPTLSGFAPWSEAFSPFAGGEAEQDGETEDRDLEDTLLELYDEGFHEAISGLAEDTEAAIADRFVGETSPYAGERERFARNYLSGVQFEAEQYLANLAGSIGGVDVASLSAAELDEALGRFDPQPGELTVAGEEFIGRIVKKAKQAVRVVASAAKAAGKLAAPFLGPVLSRLRVLVRPLLNRVLSLAIGRLPAPLQPTARSLAAKLMAKVAPAGEGEAEVGEMAPSVAVDAETLADSFDMRLAEAIVHPGTAIAEAENEAFEAARDEGFAESSDLYTLSQARGEMIDQFSAAGDRQDMTPAIEQFAPAVFLALRTGIRLVGRPKVVGFLARYLAGMIQRYVGPAHAPQLANAIVDTGMRMISLEAEAQDAAGEAAPAALASVIEDSIRRFAENDSFVFENDELAQVAAADAFSEAVATHFPQQEVREEVQLAPSLGGAFVTRQPRGLRSYAKYNRTPEIQISSRAADAIPSFGGTSLGAQVRAAGGRFPLRARMHVYQTRPGSTVPAMLRHDRRSGVPGMVAHPLTPMAAGVLLREPGLGSAVPRRFLRSHRRVAAGQRIFVLEPLAGAPINQSAPAPGRAWIAVNAAKGQVTAGFYLSEPEAQNVAEAIRKGQGHGALLQRLLGGMRAAERAAREGEGADEAVFEDGEGFEHFASKAGRSLPHGFKAVLRKRIVAWALPALSGWLKDNAEPFLRAVADPRPGVTIRVRIAGVPGLTRGASGAIPSVKALTQALRGKPAIEVLVGPGRGRA